MRISDWSSDVCSSDLGPDAHAAQRDRKTGLLEAVAEVPGATVEVRQGNFLFTSGLERGRELLDLADPPTAIFAANDEMAAGVLAAAIDRGLTVPADLSLVGRSEEHTSELQSLMRISYAVFCLKKKKSNRYTNNTNAELVEYNKLHERITH